MSKVHIYGGGTFNFVRNHLALSAPAFGTTAERLKQLLLLESELHLTKMASRNSNLVTNQDIENHLSEILKDRYVKCIIMNCALCDYDGQIGGVPSGKTSPRLESREGNQMMHLTPSSKIISNIKKVRPDIKVVGFKTTVNESDNSVMEYKADRMGVDLVLANDVGLRKNIVVNREDSISTLHSDRDDALQQIANKVKEWVTDESPIKNIRHYDTNTTYWVEIKNAGGRLDAFNKACDILNNLGITGDYINGKWDIYHQWIQKVTIRRTK